MNLTAKNKRHQRADKTFKPRMKEQVNSDIKHHEPDPGDIKTFVERMMVLGYTFETIADQTVLKYKAKRTVVEFVLKEIRNSWIAYGSLETEEKKAVLEQQLNYLFREALDKNELNIAAIAIKRKMELSGIATSNTGKGAVNCNVNIGNQGVVAEDILGPDLHKEREEKIKTMELELAATKQQNKSKKDANKDGE